MSHLKLALALHHHQPVGNFPEALEDCYKKCYWPLLQALDRHPLLKLNLSYSGPVLLFLAEKHPEYLALLKKLIHAERVEVLSNGFYAPFLADLADDDRDGHLDLMGQWLKDHLDYVAYGVWITEGVWEASLIRNFRKAGLHYSLMRAGRFVHAGAKENELNGAFVTEYQGEPFYLFPNDTNILKRMPFHEIEELFHYLRRVANRRQEQVFSAADIAERWGAWSGTYEVVHKSGYINNLFKAFEEAGEWLSLIRFSDYFAEHTVNRRIYIPAGCRWEMGAWSLPESSRNDYKRARRNLIIRHDAPQFLPFFRAGSYEGFKVRYHESNLMHKKGLWLKKLLQSTDLEDEEREECQDLLWQAQCNTAYWFGTSGGLHEVHLRKGIWERYLMAEKLLAQYRSGWEVKSYDFDANGRDEVLMMHPAGTFAVNPDYGGACFELSFLKNHINLAQHLTRRNETISGLTDDSIHPPKQPDDYDETLAADWYERYCFQDHFFNKRTETEQLANGLVLELGDFINQPYEVIDAQSLHKSCFLSLQRQGGLYRNQTRQKLTVYKTYRWDGDADHLMVEYEILNTDELPLEAVFAVEVNLYLPFSSDHVEDFIQLEERQCAFTDLAYNGKGKSLIVHSETAGLEIELKGSDYGYQWMYPITLNELHLVEAKKLHQGNSLLVGWPIDLKPRQTAKFKLHLTCREI
ncbi:MAG: alpha-amylase/4-alpha-glucanotransferase domain-containing protein [Verrucomicrobiota bacterium]